MRMRTDCWILSGCMFAYCLSACLFVDVYVGVNMQIVLSVLCMCKCKDASSLFILNAHVGSSTQIVCFY
jgi:hypothetical protein